MADPLANLVATLALGAEENITIPLYGQWVITPLVDEGVEEVKTLFVYEIDEEDWRQPFIDFLEYGRLPSESRHKAEIQRRASRFLYYKGTLYQRSFLGLWLRCLDNEEEVMEEAHVSVCEAYQSGPKLNDRVKKISYYWPTMVRDYVDFARRCNACQLHANFIHQPSKPLHPTVASWSFEAWGLDVVGPFTQKSFTRTYTFWQLQIIFPNGRRKSF